MVKHKRRRNGMLQRLMRWSQPLRYALLLPLLEGFRMLAQALPHGWGLVLGRALGRLAALIDVRERRRAVCQLEAAGIGGDRPALAGAVFQSLGMNAVEWLHSLPWTADKIRQQVRFDDMATLQDTLARERGVIFLTAHMGNWELLLRVYHAYTGQTLAAVMAQTTNPLTTRWLIRWREAGGSRLLPVHEALAIMRHLRRGGALALLADQDSTRSRGIFVDFFGRPAYTPVGPAHLARRTGAPLLPVVIVREPEDPRRHRVLMGEPILADPALDEETDLIRITQEYTRVLEGWIRRYPGQWVWIHDRWRHRPGQKIRIRSMGRK